MEAKNKRPSKAKLKSTAAARNAVFDTAELLENIFLLLPPRQVLVAKSACRQFRTIVATSPALQEMLFLKASNKNVVASERWAIVGIHRNSTRTPCSIFNDIDFAISPLPSPDTQILVEGLNVVTPNPMITLAPNHASRDADSEHACRIYTRANESEVLHLQKNIQDFILRPDPSGTESWQHMNITDPPCTTAKMEIKFRFKNRPYIKTIDITAHNGSGITMNQLLHSAAMHDSDMRQYEIKTFEPSTGHRLPTGMSVRQILDGMLKSRSHKNLVKHLESMLIAIPRTVAATEDEREQVRKELAERNDDGIEAE